jgi:hypothetical protein
LRARKGQTLVFSSSPGLFFLIIIPSTGVQSRSLVAAPEKECATAATAGDQSRGCMQAYPIPIYYSRIQQNPPQYTPRILSPPYYCCSYYYHCCCAPYSTILDSPPSLPSPASGNTFP